MSAIQTADLFKALSDPTRLALFERLSREGETTVVALTARAGVSQPAVSQHLAALKAVGLVKDRRQGRLAHYRVEPKALAPLVDWFGHYAAFWPDKLDRLETLLKDIDP